MAMSNGSVSPSSSTITGAHILQGQTQVGDKKQGSEKVTMVSCTSSSKVT